MSRSIHTTWSQMSKELKKQKAKEVPENRQKLDKMYDDLKNKRRMKREIKRQRKRDLIYISTDPVDLPVIIYDESDYVHYPATEKDIREILMRLPGGLIDGLKCIELRIGSGKEKRYDDLPDPDPYTGRPGFEILRGVYQPKVLGCYSTHSRKIEIYAYVYESLPDYKIWNVCLKLYMLMTLTHELFHHFDFQSRTGRGRWLHIEKEKVEGYAEDMEYQLLGEVVIPYIEEAYREEIYLLNEWILRNAGIKLPLSILAGDPRKYSKKSSVKSFFSTDNSVFDFVKGVYNNEELLELRVLLANDLHYAELYDISLEILKTVLDIEQQHIKALTLKSDIFGHQEKCIEAEQIAREVIAIDEGEFEPWYILSKLYFKQSDWGRLLEVSEKALKLSQESWKRDVIILDQAKAHIETGELSKAEEKIKEVSSVRSIIIKRIDELKQEIISKKEAGE